MAKTQPGYMPWYDFKSSTPRRPKMRSDAYRNEKRPRRRSCEFSLTLICDKITSSKRKGSIRLVEVFPELTGKLLTFTNREAVAMDPAVAQWLETNWSGTLSGAQSGF
ncbi:MAG: hypothetical protein R3F07_03965 [Opitutaceae bacterium]